MFCVFDILQEHEQRRVGDAILLVPQLQRHFLHGFERLPNDEEEKAVKDSSSG